MRGSGAWALAADGCLEVGEEEEDGGGHGRADGQRGEAEEGGGAQARRDHDVARLGGAGRHARKGRSGRDAARVRPCAMRCASATRGVARGEGVVAWAAWRCGARLVIAEQGVGVRQDADSALYRPGSGCDCAHRLTSSTIDLEAFLAIGEPAETRDGKEQALHSVIHASDQQAEFPTEIPHKSRSERLRRPEHQ